MGISGFSLSPSQQVKHAQSIQKGTSSVALHERIHVLELCVGWVPPGFTSPGL